MQLNVDSIRIIIIDREPVLHFITLVKGVKEASFHRLHFIFPDIPRRGRMARSHAWNAYPSHKCAFLHIIWYLLEFLHG